MNERAEIELVCGLCCDACLPAAPAPWAAEMPTADWTRMILSPKTTGKYQMRAVILDILSLKYTNCLGTRQYFTMWCFDIRFSPIFLRVTRAAIIRLTVPHARPNAGQFSYYYQDIKYNFWSDWQPSACAAVSARISGARGFKTIDRRHVCKRQHICYLGRILWWCRIFCDLWARQILMLIF